MKKRMVSFIAIFTLALSGSFFADAAVLNEVVEERELIGGVTYKHIQRLEDYGWQDVYAVQADLKAPGVKLEVLKSQNGESFLENTYQMAVDSGALAAVNADFFAAKRGQSGRGSAVGVEVRDGKLTSSASVTENMNTFYKVFGDDRFYVNAFVFNMSVTAANGKTDKIKVVNKYDDLTGIVMYTDDWGEYSVGSKGGSIEVAVDENGTVVNKVTESDPIVIPKGGYVLASHMSYNTFLLDNVNIGDVISVDIQSTPDINYIETAVGGGGIILSEGKVPSKFSHNISGRNPRSAVGIDQTGTVVTIVAVDGRRTDSKGMTQTELGYLMADLGCYTALNFDGGGSTLMAVDNNGEKEVVNKPSDGGYRKVTNSLGIMTTAEDNAPATRARFNAQDNVFVNASVKLNLTGVDDYNRQAAIDTSSAVYATDGSGTVSDGVFYPSKTGTSYVTAECGGFIAEKTFTVLPAPREMNFKETKITLNSGESYTPVIIGKDANGSKAEIRLSDAVVTVSGGAVTVSGDTITAAAPGAAVVTAVLGEISANMAVMVDGAEEIAVPDNITVPDTQNTYKDLTEEGAFRFSVFGNTRDVSTLFDQFIMNNALYKMKLSSDFQVFLGANVNTKEIEKVSNNYVLAKNYNCFGDGPNTFITLPNVSGKVYTGDISVWSKFQNDVKNAGQNLFIFLDRNFISNNQVEFLSFTKTVNAAAQSGKNVYVFGGGFVNQNTVDDGVRYINTAGVFPSVAIDGTSPSYIKYVLVTINGNEVTYEYRPIIGD